MPIGTLDKREKSGGPTGIAAAALDAPPAPKWAFESTAILDAGDLAAVQRGLDEHAVSMGYWTDFRLGLNLLYRPDPKRPVQAGLIGTTGAGIFDIQLLWVAPKLRGRGIGSALLQTSQQEALERDCFVIEVRANDERAAAFYKKHRFETKAYGPMRKDGPKTWILMKHIYPPEACLR